MKQKHTPPPEHFSVDEAEDQVEMDSMDSFPCSDAPGWTRVIAHKPCPPPNC